MSIDLQKLLEFEIPTIRQVLDPHAIALYALSVGLGRDPLDSAQLTYVDPLQGPKIMPSMVLVMAHPGFWLAHPDSGVDPNAVLHAAQRFQILGKLPQAGEVESRSRVAEVVDKGPGNAALLRIETELRDEADRLFALLERTAFIRGGGGFGGSAGAPSPRPVAPPKAAPDLIVDLDTAPEQALLYRLNGDLNPLHSDPSVASKAGFKAPILHGLCTVGVVTHALLKGLVGYRPEAIRSVRLRLSSPVYPGETIRTELWRNGHFRAVVPSRGMTIIDDGFAELDHTHCFQSGGES